MSWDLEDAKVRNAVAQADLSEAHVYRVNAETLWFETKVFVARAAVVLSLIATAALVLRAVI